MVVFVNSYGKICEKYHYLEKCEAKDQWVYEKHQNVNTNTYVISSTPYGVFFIII